MLNLVVFSCILIVCCAQEHLTCLRTDDILSQQRLQSTENVVQGIPGKRGAKGQDGSRGIKGQKGEPGITDDDHMKFFRNQLNILFEEIEALKNQTSQNRNLTVDIFKSGLHLPPNFYVYKLTPGRQSWQESREFCQNWGGDLAVHGVKTLENRKKLIQNLSTDYHFWIGVNDIASEGNWVWVTGQRAGSSELFWAGRQPDSYGGNQDCVIIHGAPQYSFAIAVRAYDDQCNAANLGLCEKMVSY